MRCDFQRCTTSSCYIANQFSYQDKRKKILIRRSLFFFFFFSGLLKCIRMKDNEGNINSKILILLLFFSFEDVYRARVEFVHDCIGSIQDCICFERKKKQTNGCHRAFTHIEQWVLSWDPFNIQNHYSTMVSYLASFSKNVSLCEKCARNQLCRIAIALVFLSLRPWAPTLLRILRSG